MPDKLLKSQRVMWRRSFWISGAICMVGLVGVTLVAVKWGNPIPIHVPNRDLSGTILFGWLVIALASVAIVPAYLALHSRAVRTPPQFRQMGLGTVERLNTIQAPQAMRPDATPEFSRMVGVMTADATHWGLAATFDGFSWGFRLRPSRFPIPVKRVVPLLSSAWSRIDEVEEIDYPSLIPVFVVKLRDPEMKFGIALGSVPSLSIVNYLRQHGVRIRFVNPRKWGPAAQNP
jgi:hypothetical protein